jgi:hypothetical protein
MSLEMFLGFWHLKKFHSYYQELSLAYVYATTVYCPLQNHFFAGIFRIKSSSSEVP